MIAKYTDGKNKLIFSRVGAKGMKNGTIRNEISFRETKMFYNYIVIWLHNLVAIIKVTELFTSKCKL